MSPTDVQTVRPTTIEIPETDLVDMYERLARTRFTDPAPADHGVPVDEVAAWVEHWRERFDWRALEARLNTIPQYETEIDGQRVHFFHVRSGRPDAVGLVLTHGWPGTVLEHVDVIEPLVAAGYDVVVPSIPGFGFSGPTTDGGWGTQRVARAWVTLMHRLGYERYGAVGNDGGSMISPEVGRLDPEHVVGVHVTQLFSFPTGDPAEMENLREDEQAALGHLQWFWENMGAFNTLHTQAPQTIAHALADSPAGLLAWNGQLLRGLDPAFVVGNVAISWLTRTSGSSIRFYRASAAESAPEGPTTVPTALCESTNDFRSIRRFAERDHANIVRWRTYDTPGHYTSVQAPDVWLRDVTEFFGSL
jgi:pimeloyl-ACP methyl ester carboxylesterase